MRKLSKPSKRTDAGMRVWGLVYAVGSVALWAGIAVAKGGVSKNRYRQLPIFNVRPGATELGGVVGHHNQALASACRQSSVVRSII